MAEMKVRIAGMSCQHCVAAVERSLRGAPGVGKVEVRVGEARIGYDAMVISPEALRQRIRDAGYEPEAA